MAGGDSRCCSNRPTGRWRGQPGRACGVLLRTTGERAHSARSSVGANAVHAAAPVLAKLAAYQPRRPVIDGLEYREGLNAVGISGEWPAT
ncbi:hypothetical protein SFUMM280S_04844 [Streptomyces fumanus]